MFINKLKIKTLTILLTILIIPQSIYAYSNKIIASGDTVGIKLNTNGVLIVGSYKINNRDSIKESDLKIGDIITSIDNKKISKVEELTDIIKNCNCNSIDITYIRNNKENKTNINLYEDDGILKTGLYVKDSISGVGTLTFIDPNTNLFGVLGHEIIDNNTGKIIDIKDGYIFDSKITGITKSDEGNPGEKNALLFSDKVNGEIYENTNKGLFGKYTSNINNEKLYEVADIKDVKLGPAKILTVLKDNKVEEFDINILSFTDTDSKLKNIQFEITDKKLLESTNGIIQGMSGSPIIQDHYIIGAVTHVVVNDPHRGYGIFIRNMLEEAEN